MLLAGVTNAARDKESAMDQVLEQRPAPEAIPEIEATLNYFVNDGTKIFTEAAGAGERDKRGGTIDPHEVVIHNGRLHSAEFEFEHHGFRFVRHDTRVTNFFTKPRCGGSITAKWKTW
jgi:hypothetical protein